MDRKSNTKIKLNLILLIISGTPLVLILLGLLIELIKFVSYKIHPIYNGMVNVSIEHLLFTGGIYLALPCGILMFTNAISARSKGMLGKKVAIFAIVFGIFGMLFGILALIYYVMVSSFVF